MRSLIGTFKHLLSSFILYGSKNIPAIISKIKINKHEKLIMYENMINNYVWIFLTC